MGRSFTANVQNTNVHALCSLLSIFSEVGLLFSCLKFFVAPLAPPELGGPGSLNRLNPRFLRHWLCGLVWSLSWVGWMPVLCGGHVTLC